ncbi:hypothetical protein V6U77_12565 [Micromonospora sp. CPCC 205546]|uniref:aldose epimerase family protein n=1 Tax=Micromonospora sp. CPCC 205546 TaxID=3122397 RepID=UPI002FF32899
MTLSCPTLEVEVWSLGATLVGVTAKSAGASVPLVARLADLAEYDDPARNHFVGCTMGRWCRMITDGQFEIDGNRYDLRRDRRGRHAHGGPAGFHAQRWDLRVDDSRPSSRAAVFTLASPDGHQGYPGAVEAQVEYRLSDDGVLTVDYRGVTSAPTLFGLANHVYWRVDDEPIDAHELLLPAGRRLEIVDDVPSPDSPVPVAGTESDFRTRRVLGTQAVDAYFVLDGPSRACELAVPHRGIALTLSTTASGVGVYTGDHDPVARRGICLEFGGWPGAERRADFPSPVLRPGEVYEEGWELRVTGR